MFIIEVIPLASLHSQVPQVLSYFFNERLQKGALVEGLIGKKKVMSVVISSTPLEEHKTSVKKSDFQLKKLSSVIEITPQVGDSQFKIAIWLAKNYYAPLGLCLKTVLPNFFSHKNYLVNKQFRLDAPDHYLDKPVHPVHEEKKVNLKPTVLIINAKHTLENLNLEIKRTVTSGQQVLFIVPEIHLIDYFRENLESNYRVAVIHSKVPLKKLWLEWQNISKGVVSVIIGTRLALFNQFHNLGLIIVEDYKHEAYKSDLTPKYMTSKLANFIAGLYSCPIIMTSPEIDTSTYYAQESGMADIKTLNSQKIDFEFTDILQEIKDGNYSLFSIRSQKLIKDFHAAKKRILIFSSRRGYSGIFICENCGFTEKCEHCSVPIRYHKTKEPILICHRCSLSKKVPVMCSNCKSYKIKPAGIAGSQKLREKATELFKTGGNPPEVVIIDATTGKNVKTRTELIKKSGLVVVATQALFSFRYVESFDLIVVPFLDSLMSVPDFRSEEDILYQFAKLKDFDPKKVIVQTYDIVHPLVEMLETENYRKFYDHELLLRKTLSYPPFFRLIKITYRHFDRDRAFRETKILSEKLKMVILRQNMEDVKIFGPNKTFIEKEKSMFSYNIIIKTVPSQKPESILKYVPNGLSAGRQGWSVDIDPKTIL